MNDSLSVSRRERIAHLQRDREGAVQTERLARDQLLQRLARNVLHRDEVLTIDFRDFEYGADVGMVEGRRETCLSEEALSRILFRHQVGREQLKHNRAVEV